MFASSLNSASPPFYPSGSSSKDVTRTQKRDVQAGSTNRNVRQSVLDESFSVPQTNALVRGKNIAESVSMDKLYIDDSSNSAAGKTMNNLQMQPSGLSLVNTNQPSQSRAQGRAVLQGQMRYQPAPPHNQVARASSSTPLHAVQRSPAQNRAQPAVQNSTQQLGQRPGSGSRTSSPPKTALSISSVEPGEVESPLDTSKSKTALIGKGKGIVQGSGRGSQMHGGAQVIAATGSMGVNHGDQNFPGAPTFLPGDFSWAICHFKVLLNHIVMEPAKLIKYTF